MLHLDDTEPEAAQPMSPLTGALVVAIWIVTTIGLMLA